MQVLGNTKLNHISFKSCLYKLLGSRRLLQLWYKTKRECIIPSKDFRLFTGPIKKEDKNEVFLWHIPSCRSVRLDPVAADLMRLATASPSEAKEIIPTIARNHSAEGLAEGFQSHATLLAWFNGRTTPPPSTMEPPPQKGELLIFGNLVCNLRCPYCLSRDAREEADKGKAPKLMPIETAKRSIRFIAEKMAGKAEHIYINFTLGGEPLLSFDRYRLLRDYCSEVSDEFGIPVTLNMNTNGTVFTDGFIEYCEQNGVQMAVSLDGSREIHDAMRPFQSGEGSYDALVCA